MTLGAKERELVQDAQWSYTFAQITQTIGGILTNPVVLLGIAGYIAYKLDQILDPDWRAIVADMTGDREQFIRSYRYLKSRGVEESARWDEYVKNRTGEEVSHKSPVGDGEGL